MILCSIFSKIRKAFYTLAKAGTNFINKGKMKATNKHKAPADGSDSWKLSDGIGAGFSAIFHSVPRRILNFCTERYFHYSFDMRPLFNPYICHE
jgi:hypothetical protein